MWMLDERPKEAINDVAVRGQGGVERGAIPPHHPGRQTEALAKQFDNFFRPEPGKKWGDHGPGGKELPRDEVGQLFSLCRFRTLLVPARQNAFGPGREPPNERL